MLEGSAGADATHSPLGVARDDKVGVAALVVERLSGILAVTRDFEAYPCLYSTNSTIYTNPMKSSILFFLSAFVILLLPARVFAQAGMEVTVFDIEANEVVEGAVVMLTNASIGFETSAVSDAQGKVRFRGLSTSGQYEVYTPSSGDWHEARAANIVLRSNFTRSVALVLYPISSYELEEITVSGVTSFATINTINAEISSTLQPEEIALLPIEGRDITRALYRLPNVTQATGFFPEAPTVSINGANSLYTNYMIDGMDNNENFLGGQKFPVPIGIAQDVTVLTNNYSTEFGRTGNGVFNVTTKSGGNTFSGEAFYLTRPGPSLDSDSDFAQRDLSGNQVQDGFMRQQAGIAIGGPIVEDQTFFYINAEQTLDFKDNFLTVPSLGINDRLEGQNMFSYISGKIDHRWSDRLTSTLRGHLAFVEIERQGGGLEGGVTFPSAGNIQDRNAILIASQNTYVAPQFVYEGNVQFSRFRWNYARPTGSGGPGVTVLGSDGLTLAVLGHPGFVFDDLENTVQLQQKITLPRNRHTIKAGIDFISSDFALNGGGNEEGNYTIQLTQDQEEAIRASGVDSGLDVTDFPSDVEVVNYAVELMPNSFGDRQNLFSLYVEDLISVSPKLNVTVGLRYDYDNLSKGGADEGDLNNIAPRLNFNYTLDERSSLRGGYGIFYEKIVYAVHSDALQQNSTAAGFRNQLQQLIDRGVLPSDTDLDRVTFDGNLTVNPQDVTYLQGPTPATVQDLRASAFSNERRILNPNGYDNPYTHQFSLGYQRQLGQNYLFYVDLMHTRSFNLFRLRDLNSPAPYNVESIPPDPTFEANSLVRSQEEADATRPIPFLDADGNAIPGAARGIIVSESEGESRYWAANVNLLKDRGTDPYAFRLSYTLSELRNNTEDINFRALDANNFDNEWGPSINDRTHVISGIFYYYPLDALSVSLAALVQSGQPINRIPDATIFGTTDLNGDGRSFADAYQGNSDRHPGESRNSDRLPWASTFDLGLQYTLSINERQFELRADVFNLFNTVTWSGYPNNATQSNQIQVGPRGSERVRRNAGPPRQFQFGLRYMF